MDITVVPATYYHLRQLAYTIRLADEREALGMGLTVTQALVRTFREASVINTALVNGEVAAIFGISGTFLGVTGFPFFITSKVADTVPALQFFRLYKSEFDKIKDLYPELEQFVDCTYTGALRLLKLVGFTWTEKKIRGLHGVEYFHVTYKRLTQ